MALTTNTTLFGANGVYDPEIFKTGVAIKRKIDFDLANATGSTNYEFLPLPKGFVLKGVGVKELVKCGASTTITVKTKTGEDTLGAAVSVGGSTLADTFMKPVASSNVYVAATSGGQVTTPKTIPAADKDYASGDMICIVAGANLTSGVIEITVLGDLYTGDTLNGLELANPYRSAGQTPGANASKGDIYVKR